MPIYQGKTKWVRRYVAGLPNDIGLVDIKWTALDGSEYHTSLRKGDILHLDEGHAEFCGTAYAPGKRDEILLVHDVGGIRSVYPRPVGYLVSMLEEFRGWNLDKIKSIQPPPKVPEIPVGRLNAMRGN